MREVFKELGLIGKPLPTLNEFGKLLRSEWESQSQLSRQAERSKRYRKIDKFINYLDQEPNISMFVPAVKYGDKWVVLDKPNEMTYKDIDGFRNERFWIEDNQQYQQAEENVLFSGFEIVECNTFYTLNLKCGFSFLFSKSNPTKNDFIFSPPATLNDMVNDGIELIIK